MRVNWERERTLMNEITAIIIAKNEGDFIQDSIKSVQFCSEIIVVDNTSTDNTGPVSRKLGAKVISSSANDFSILRTEGLEKASGDWVLYIDADERVSEELKKEILTAIKDDHSFSAYRVTRKNFYLGNHSWPKREKLERLFKKSHLKKWYGKLHESPRVEGKIGDLMGELIHYSHRDLSSMLSKTIEWSDIEAKLRYDSSHPPMVIWRFIRIICSSFFVSYIKEGGWKAGTAGLIESTYQAFSMFITYAKLWELQENAKNN